MFIHLGVNALERTRTSTPKRHRPSTYRVYQFRHQGQVSLL